MNNEQLPLLKSRTDRRQHSDFKSETRPPSVSSEED